ncbi:hypothetical protein TVAG_341690 [Trichomonas vaginalis G3]|uniref:Uncharacterized protein n=1 Tax=Trichomonas vaginalis (strain ATCC PRA-98 / G3) TaxID=412133 RepID=A2G694_TRIV3|nr:hypothetical protein TVAGG3_0815540 [Trichomonas vaginalis G3]EAX87322.1 hypothetical protein TVAG_341690 [Trichomonas vaginalis G3]KAI5497508.1 hypothetical protein TVAGG3_0815540 [Trichomonas vaginalis G3]|eukprot:XP_001300252.1 hypothetical protein [Trichomonas vaginalis G3]
MEKILELFCAKTPEKFQEAVSILRGLPPNEDTKFLLHNTLISPPPSNFNQEEWDLVRYIVGLQYLMSKNGSVSLLKKFPNLPPPQYGPLFCLLNRIPLKNDNSDPLAYEEAMRNVKNAFSECIKRDTPSQYFSVTLENYLHRLPECLYKNATEALTIIDSISQMKFDNLSIKGYQLIIDSIQNPSTNPKKIQIIEAILRSNPNLPSAIYQKLYICACVQQGRPQNDQIIQEKIILEMYNHRFRYDLSKAEIFSLKNINYTMQFDKLILSGSNKIKNGIPPQMEKQPFMDEISKNANTAFIFYSACLLQETHSISDLLKQRGLCLYFNEIGASYKDYVPFQEQPHSLNKTSDLDYLLVTNYNPIIVYSKEESKAMFKKFSSQVNADIEKFFQVMRFFNNWITKNYDSYSIISNGLFNFIIQLIVKMMIVSGKCSFLILNTNLKENRKNQNQILTKESQYNRYIADLLKNLFNSSKTLVDLSISEDISNLLIEAVMEGNHTFRLVQSFITVFCNDGLPTLHDLYNSIVEKMFMNLYLKLQNASNCNNEDCMRQLEQVFLFILRIAEKLKIEKNESFGRMLESIETKFLMALIKLSKFTVCLDIIYRFIIQYYNALEFHCPSKNEKNGDEKQMKAKECEKFERVTTNSQNSAALAYLMRASHDKQNSNFNESEISQILENLKIGLNSEQPERVSITAKIFTKVFPRLKLTKIDNDLFMSLLDALPNVKERNDQQEIADFICKIGFNSTHEKPYKEKPFTFCLEGSDIDINAILTSLSTTSTEKSQTPFVFSFLNQAIEEIKKKYENDNDQNALKDVLTKFHYIATDLSKFKAMHNHIMDMYKNLNDYFADIICKGGNDIYFLSLISVSMHLESYTEHFTLYQVFNFLKDMKSKGVQDEIVKKIIDHMNYYYNTYEFFCFMNACTAIKKVFPHLIGAKELINITAAIVNPSIKIVKQGAKTFGKIVRSTIESSDPSEVKKYIDYLYYTCKYDRHYMMFQQEIFKALKGVNCRIDIDGLADGLKNESLIIKSFKICLCLVCGFNSPFLQVNDERIIDNLIMELSKNQKDYRNMYLFYLLFLCFVIGPYKDNQNIKPKFMNNILARQIPQILQIPEVIKLRDFLVPQDPPMIDTTNNVFAFVRKLANNPMDPEPVKEILKSNNFKPRDFENPDFRRNFGPQFRSFIEDLAKINEYPYIQYSSIKQLMSEMIVYYPNEVCETLRFTNNNSPKICHIFEYVILTTCNENFINKFLEKLEECSKEYVENPVYLGILKTVSEDKKIAKIPKLKSTSKQLFSFYFNIFKEKTPKEIGLSPMACYYTGCALINSFIENPEFSDISVISQLYEIPMLSNSELSVLYENGYNEIPNSKRIEFIDDIAKDWDKLSWRSLVVPFQKINDIQDLPPDLIENICDVSSHHLSLTDKYLIPSTLLITKLIIHPYTIHSEIYTKLMVLLPQIFGSIDSETVVHAFEISISLCEKRFMPDEVYIEISSLLIACHYGSEFAFMGKIREFLNLRPDLFEPVPFVIHQVVHTCVLDKLIQNSCESTEVDRINDLFKEVPSLQKCLPFSIFRNLFKDEGRTRNIDIFLRDIKLGIHISQNEYDEILRSHLIFSHVNKMLTSAQDNPPQAREKMFIKFIPYLALKTDPINYKPLIESVIMKSPKDQIFFAFLIFFIANGYDFDKQYVQQALYNFKASANLLQALNDIPQKFVKQCLAKYGLVDDCFKVFENWMKSLDVENPKLDLPMLFLALELIEFGKIDLSWIPLIWEKCKNGEQSPGNYYTLTTKINYLGEDQTAYAQIIADIAKESLKNAELFVNSSVMNLQQQICTKAKILILQEIIELVMIYNVTIPHISVHFSMNLNSTPEMSDILAPYSLQMLIAYSMQATPSSRIKCLKKCQEITGKTPYERMMNLVSFLPPFFWCDKYLTVLCLIVIPQDFEFWTQLAALATCIGHRASISIGVYTFKKIIEIDSEIIVALLKNVLLSIQRHIIHTGVLEALTISIVQSDLIINTKLAFKATKKTGDLSISLNNLYKFDEELPTASMVMPHEINDFVFAKYINEFAKCGKNFVAGAIHYLLGNFEESYRLLHVDDPKIETTDVVNLFMSCSERLTMRENENISDFLQRILGSVNFSVDAIAKLLNEGENKDAQVDVDKIKDMNIYYLLLRKAAPSIMNSERFVLLQNILSFYQHQNDSQIDRMRQPFSPFNSAFFKIYTEAKRKIKKDSILDITSQEEEGNYIVLSQEFAPLVKVIVGETKNGQIVVTSQRISNALRVGLEDTSNPENFRLWGGFLATIFELSSERRSQDKSIVSQCINIYIHYLKYGNYTLAKKYESASRIVFLITIVVCGKSLEDLYDIASEIKLDDVYRHLFMWIEQLLITGENNIIIRSNIDNFCNHQMMETKGRDPLLQIAEFARKDFNVENRILKPLPMMSRFASFIYNEFGEYIDLINESKFICRINEQGMINLYLANPGIINDDSKKLKEIREIISQRNLSFEKFIDISTRFNAHLELCNREFPLSLPSRMPSTLETSTIYRLTGKICHLKDHSLLIEFINDNCMKRQILIHRNTVSNHHEISVMNLFGCINSIFNSCYVTSIRGFKFGTSSTYELRSHEMSKSDSKVLYTMTVLSSCYEQLGDLLNLEDESDENCQRAENYLVSKSNSKDDLIKRRIALTRSLSANYAVKAILELQDNSLFISPSSASFFTERNKVLLRKSSNFVCRIPKPLKALLGPLSQEVMSVGIAAATSALAESSLSLSAVLDTAIVCSDRTLSDLRLKIFERRKEIIDNLLEITPPVHTLEGSTFEWLDKIM